MRTRLLLWSIVTVILYRQAVPLLLLLQDFPLNDFSVYLDGARATLEGKNPYLMRFFDRYNYSPTATLFFSLLTFVPNDAAEVLFTSISLLALWFALSWTLQIVEWNPNRAMKCLIFALAWKTFPVKLTLALGQINIMILVLLVGSFYFYKKSNNMMSGFLFGLATVLKMTPAPIIMYFFLKKQWKVVASFGTTVIVLVLCGILVFGWELTHFYITSVIPSLLKETERHSINTTYMNQSLSAFFARVGIFGQQNSLLRLAISSVAFLWVMRLHRHQKNDFLLFWNLVIISMLFLSVFVWQHHYVLLLPFLLISIKEFINKKKKKLFIFVITSYGLLNIYIADTQWFAGKHPLLLSHFLLLGILLLFFGNLLISKQQQIRRPGNN